MNRDDFQQLAVMRLADAKVLLATGTNANAAYYLAGYAVECALKACIAKRTMQYQFPPLDVKEHYYTHNLNTLAKTAQLSSLLEQEVRGGTVLGRYWETVLRWSEQNRYVLNITQQDALDIVQAIEDEKEGVLIWLQQHW